MTMTSRQIIQDIVSDFNRLPDWESRYKLIIDIGKALPPLAQEHKNDENLVRGCQSKVWLVARQENGKVIFEADSDAAIVKGLVAILLKVYSGQTPKDILETSPNFIQDLGLNTNLSQARANGLVSMIKQIKFYALAFSQL